MSASSTATFPGQFRVHVALNVANVERSIAFYKLLLGVEPSKVRPRYAKFEPTDPSVNLTLNEATPGGDVSVAGGDAHFGIQVKSTKQVEDAIQRFQQAGFQTEIENATTCCYAVQDKVWVTDLDGHRWEVFVVLQADANEGTADPTGCCVPDLHSIGGL